MADLKKAALPEVDLNNYIIDPEILNILPEGLARKHRMIPLFRVRNVLTVAMADPADIVAADEARNTSACEIQVVKADEQKIISAIDQSYTVGNSIEDITHGLQNVGAELEKEGQTASLKIQKVSEEAPVVKLVNLIIAQAVKDKASDIHIEPEEEQARVRLRIDGMLHNLINFPRGLHLPVVRRIKVIAGLDIMDRKGPQDGHFTLRMVDKEVDVRISTFPVTYGDKVVMRLLDRSGNLLTLEKLGFSGELLRQFESAINKPFGIFLVTGPTGSGKTTTLYAALSKLNSSKKNIITLEDPREYFLKGINQGEVDAAIGLTFASGLRAILRQDPDIIMIGEIRDAETVQIAIRSALTGHLVLSTLHTNDAVGTISRLIDMGVDPFLISASLIGVLAQRLVRGICPNCKEQYAPSPDIAEKLGLANSKNAFLFRGKGCMHCKHTGYKGRVGIFEFLILDDNLKEMVTKNRPVSEIKEYIRGKNFRTLQSDGFDKVRNGITTLDEVLRVTCGDE